MNTENQEETLNILPTEEAVEKTTNPTPKKKGRPFGAITKNKKTDKTTLKSEPVVQEKIKKKPTITEKLAEIKAKRVACKAKIQQLEDEILKKKTTRKSLKEQASELKKEIKKLEKLIQKNTANTLQEV